MTDKTYRYSRDIPVMAEYDVVVCGGGPAGCAAAITSARNGAKTLLVEKNGYLGGATVSQLVCVVLSTNGVDFQGIWHEWARRLRTINAMAPIIRNSKFFPDCLWFRSSVDTEGVKRVWDDMTEEAGADTLLLAHICGACVEDSRITGLVLHTRAGLRVIRANRVIDATGNADVCHDAGVPWDRGVTGKLWPQQVSLMFRAGGFPVPGKSNGLKPGFGGTGAYRPEQLNRINKMRVDPLDPFTVSKTLRQARREIAKKMAKLPSERYLVDTASELGVRTSRVVRGMAKVTDDDVWNFRKSNESIARASWEIDIHPPDDEAPLPERWLHSKSDSYAAFTRRLSKGEWFDIPYGCLVTKQVDNLLVAGRCVSSSYLAQASLRIQQTCMATGEAAGLIAALSLSAGKTPRELEPATAVRKLEEEQQVEPAFPELAEVSPKSPVILPA